VENASVDWEQLGKRRAAVSESLSSGVQMLWQKNKVTLIEGDGSLTADANVRVGEEVHEAETVILATGSVALPIPGVEFGDRVLDTWGAWSLAERPGRIAVVGAGASGAELASAYARFGTEVLLIEMLDQILPGRGQGHGARGRAGLQEAEHRDLHRRPVENVEAGESRSSSPTASSRPRSTTSAWRGRRPPTSRGSASRRPSRARRSSGKIKVDEFSRTANPKVYAIGDLVNAKALAHKASEEGVVAVEHAAGVETHPVDQNLVCRRDLLPPAGAERRPHRGGGEGGRHEVKVGKLKLGGVGGATVYDDKDGMVKLVVDAKYGEILGAHVVGNRACDMIAELVATMALEGGYQELARVIHPHPTISEAIPEGARAVDGWAIHA
jgi:dihydrolipoamide dehydrogenase